MSESAPLDSSRESTPASVIEDLLNKLSDDISADEMQKKMFIEKVTSIIIY